MGREKAAFAIPIWLKYVNSHVWYEIQKRLYSYI